MFRRNGRILETSVAMRGTDDLPTVLFSECDARTSPQPDQQLEIIQGGLVVYAALHRTCVGEVTRNAR